MTIDAADDPARREAAAIWFLRLAEGELAPEAQADMDAWLAEDDRHAMVLEQVIATAAAMEEISADPEVLAMRGEALASVRRANRMRWTRRLPPAAWIATAAAAIVLAAAGLVWFQSAPTVYRTHAGQRQMVMLADGSRLSLDGETRVDVRLGEHRRELRLKQGRARFTVAKDPLRPFTVAAGDRTVVATGTQFSVELLRDDVHVVLFEGRVAVLAARAADRSGRKEAAAEIDLVPGQQLVARSDPAAPAVSRVDLSRSAAWEAGQLIFDEEPLASAVERVNRYSARKVRLSGAPLSDVRVSGVFEAGDPDAFVTGVSQVWPVRVNRTADGWVLLPG